jgi:hypothetical protein
VSDEEQILKAKKIAYALADVEPATLGLALGQLTFARQHDDPLVIALVSAVDIMVARYPRISDYYGDGPWHRQHDLLPSNLLRRRYPPNGCREEWVEFGPNGRPETT